MTQDNEESTAAAVTDAGAATGMGNGPVRAPGEMTRELFITRTKEKRIVDRVELPWIAPGAHAYVVGMTSRARDRFEASLLGGENKDKIDTDNIRAKLLVRSVCDANGVLLFSDVEAETLGALDAKTASALYNAAQAASGFSEKDIKEIEKNLKRDGSGDSASLSQQSGASSQTS